MAKSTCVKCGSHNFETVVNTPEQSKFQLLFIQCAECGNVVGVLDYFNIGTLIKQFAKRLHINL